MTDYPKGTITLPPEYQKPFERMIKRGILKQLHAENMLTDEQLSLALSELQREEKNDPCVSQQNTCTS